ncbi:hypothetical protein ACFLTO_06010 [Chloroflexota bacterium]
MTQQDLPIKQKKGHGIHKWLVLFTICINSIIGTTDMSMINISMPKLTATFEVEISTVIWILLAFMLTMSGLLLTLGKAGDILGKKRIYLIGSICTLECPLFALIFSVFCCFIPERKAC